MREPATGMLLYLKKKSCCWQGNMKLQQHQIFQESQISIKLYALCVLKQLHCMVGIVRIFNMVQF